MLVEEHSHGQNVKQELNADLDHYVLEADTLIFLCAREMKTHSEDVVAPNEDVGEGEDVHENFKAGLLRRQARAHDLDHSDQ